MKPSSLIIGIVLGLTSLANVSCLEVADGRAAYDLQVGKASADGASIDVADGLAAVLAFDSERTELWSQAPSLDVTLDLPAGSHTLTARNTLADAVWSIGSGGESVDATVVDEQLPTVKTVEFQSSGEPVIARLRAPDRDDDTPWTFVAVADIQDEIGNVQDIYQKMREDASVRFGVISGDLTEQGAPDELIRFQQEMEGLPFPLYATLGNHELGNGDHEFQDRFGRVNFSFEHRGVRFTMLDSASATLAPQVWTWLEEWLRAGSEQGHVVIMHIPPLDPAGTRNGAWASREEAGYFTSELGRGSVDLAIYGHIHSFYAYESAGVPSYITGGGGAIPQQFDGIDRHFLSIDVDPRTQRFDVAMVRVD